MMARITIGLTLFGVFMFVVAFARAQGAVQEADAAAVGMMFAVMPFVIYKVLHCEQMAKDQRAMIALLAALKDRKPE